MNDPRLYVWTIRNDQMPQNPDNIVWNYPSIYNMDSAYQAAQWARALPAMWQKYGYTAACQAVILNDMGTAQTVFVNDPTHPGNNTDTQLGTSPYRMLVNEYTTRLPPGLPDTVQYPEVDRSLANAVIADIARLAYQRNMPCVEVIGRDGKHLSFYSKGPYANYNWLSRDKNAPPVLW